LVSDAVHSPKQIFPTGNEKGSPNPSRSSFREYETGREDKERSHQRKEKRSLASSTATSSLLGAASDYRPFKAEMPFISLIRS